MQDININEIWIDVETLAKLKNITKRAVRLSLNQNKYEYKIDSTRGGKTYKIKLCSLEKDLQTKYIQDFYMDFKHKTRKIDFRISKENGSGKVRFSFPLVRF